LASKEFDYGVDKDKLSFNGTIEDEDDEGTLLNITTYDVVPFFNRTLQVAVNESASALIRSFCRMTSGGYDASITILRTYCGDESNYSVTVMAGNQSLTTNSDNGTIWITRIPEGEFSAIIKNEGSEEILCDTFLLGVGSDLNPEEGFNINISCYDKDEEGKEINMWWWLGPVVAVVGAALGIGSGTVGYRAAKSSGGSDGIEM